MYRRNNLQDHGGRRAATKRKRDSTGGGAGGGGVGGGKKAKKKGKRAATAATLADGAAPSLEEENPEMARLARLQKVRTTPLRAKKPRISGKRGAESQSPLLRDLGALLLTNVNYAFPEGDDCVTNNQLVKKQPLVQCSPYA